MSVSKVDQALNTQVPLHVQVQAVDCLEADAKLQRAASVIYKGNDVLGDVNTFTHNSLKILSKCVSAVSGVAEVVYAIGVSSLLGDILTLVTGSKWFMSSVRRARQGHNENNWMKMVDGTTAAVVGSSFMALGAATAVSGVHSVVGAAKAAGLVTSFSVLGFISFGLLAAYSTVKAVEKYREYKMAVSHEAKVEAHKELLKYSLLTLVSILGIAAFAVSTAFAGPFGPILIAISLAPLWVLLNSSPIFDKLAKRLAPKKVEKIDTSSNIKERMRMLNERRKSSRISGLPQHLATVRIRPKQLIAS